MAISFIESIKLRHYYNMLDKTVTKGNLVSFYHVVNTRNLDVNDPEVLNRLIKIIEQKLSRGEITDMYYLFEMNITSEMILNNKTLKKAYIEYYAFNFERVDYLSDSSINYHSELLKELITDEQFKNEFAEKIQIQEFGLKVLSRCLGSLSLELVEGTKENLNLLMAIGFKINKEDIFNLMIRKELYQSSLLMLGLIDSKDIASLYHHNFEILKDWFKNGSKDRYPKLIPIDEYIKPDPEDKMATYWYEQTRKLGFDAMAFVFSKIKDYTGKDVFSEADLPTLFEEWQQENPYYDNPKKEFYSKLEKNTGRLFTKDGIPTSLLFSTDDYKLDFLESIIRYNYEGHANGRYYYKEYPRELISFFINNIDRIPKKYQFLFKKLDEFSKIEDHYLAERVCKEFLCMMTDGHRMYESPLFDENGFTPRFYESLLYEKVEHIEIIEPHWREHLSKVKLTYIDKYNEILPPIILSSIYDEEKNAYAKKMREEGQYLTWEDLEEKFPSRNGTDLVERYFTENGPKREVIVIMLQKVGLRMKLLEIETTLLLNEEKAYLEFLRGLNNPLNIDIPLNEIKKYFSAEGPKNEFSRYLYNLQEYDMILDAKLEYKDVLKTKEVKILDEYKKVDDMILKKVYKDFITEHKDDISEERIDLLVMVLKRISKSNSTEMLNLRGPLAVQLLATDDPLKNLDEVEQIFLRNNLPTVGKIYSVFEILHPDFAGFRMENSMISPVLQKKGNRSRAMIVFSDLLRATMGSNNRSMLNYLKSIKDGNRLYKQLKNGEIELTDKEKEVLDNFLKHLITLYNNTLKGRLDNQDFIISGDYVKDIDKLMELLSPTGDLDYNLADRLVDMFCHFAGITTLEEAEEYMEQKRSAADKRNRSTRQLELSQGDFVKGIGGITHLGHILQNGSVSKEYLGAYSTSDATPLDTDLSMVLNPQDSIGATIGTTEARSYGPIWFILKNDERFAFTRRSSADPDQSIVETPPISKFETFYTGAVGQGHYGIRTGFASSEINAIVVEKWDKRIALEIVMNGFYIPVFDTQGKLIFTPENYDLLRDKMRGLKEFQTPPFIPSDELSIPGVDELVSEIPASIEDVVTKRKAINYAISKALNPLGITIKDHYDGDLSEGLAELIDTGSTGRFTNMPGDGDFDFMLKLDRKIMEDPSRLAEVKTSLLKAFNVKNNEGVIATGDFRLKGINLEGLKVPVDIDITFETKTDKIAYSTDECLKDRLSSLKETHPKEYLLIVANILLAKKLLKKFEVYKPNRGEVPQGGLGGVGIENWILQNGGSLKNAAESFLAAAEGKNFEEFKEAYVIWDFGENHLVTRKDIYPHDNFVYNMSADGYEKMKKVLKEFLLTINQLKENAKVEDVINGMSK